MDVEGPFTVLAGLIPTERLFLAKRKKPEVLKQLLFTIADELASYTIEAIKRGVTVISFSDPQSGIDLVGKDFYESFNGKAIIHFMKKVEPFLTHSLVHICGKTSFGLLQTQLVTAKQIDVSPSLYRTALCNLSKDKMIHFIGHACMNKMDFETDHVFELILP